MSDFFNRPPASPEPRKPSPHPPWAGPPAGVLPAVVAAELVLASNEAAAVYVGRCSVYPEGLEFEVRAISSGLKSLDPSLNGVYLRDGLGPEGTYPSMLRFGVEFSDGRKVTNVGGSHPADDGEPSEPVLWGMGGGGSNLSWQQNFWLWPLPPRGPVSFVCEWPAADIALTRAEIDGQLLIDAAARARVVFPDQHDSGPHRHSGPRHHSSVSIRSSSAPADEPPAPA